MSDRLRERLLAAMPSTGLGLTDYERGKVVDVLLPAIENELAETALRSAQHAEDIERLEAEKAETIEVLEGMPAIEQTYEVDRWLELRVQPHLNKLKSES